MTIRGFIVGIERYDVDTWDVGGPCINAIRTAKWLDSICQAGDKIDLFLWSSKDLNRAIVEIEGQCKHVTVHVAGDAATIDAFWRTKLAKDVPAGSKLLVFWSGHGFTSKRRNRIFFCGDYQPDLPSRIFNCTFFLNRLLTPAYACFAEQLVFADVCSVYDNTEVDDQAVELNMARRKQLAYFAVPEGEYAKNQEGWGVFSSTLLQILEREKGWPVHEQFAPALRQALAELGASPFEVYRLYNGAEDWQYVGCKNAYFRSVVDLLSEHDAVDRVVRPHYLRTIDTLGNPELGNVKNVEGAIKELSALGPGKGVPAGLLQLLVRLAGEKDLHEPIEQWLKTNAEGQKKTVAELRSRLETEAQNKILLILTEVNARENIAAFKAFLCSNDCVILPDRKFKRATVSTWKDFERRLRELLDTFVVNGHLSNIEIHFAVDACLFDRAFHLMQIGPGGNAIGEETVVVVRDKQRMLSADQRLKQDWQKYAEALRSQKPADLKWLKLTVANELPSATGLFCANFTLPEPKGAKRANQMEKSTVRRLLQLGVPYVYLPHDKPGAAAWNKVEFDLTTLVGKSLTLGEFPSTFRRERIRRSRIASGGTIIWDDPMAVPINLTEGVRFG